MGVIYNSMSTCLAQHWPAPILSQSFVNLLFLVHGSMTFVSHLISFESQPSPAALIYEVVSACAYESALVSELSLPLLGEVKSCFLCFS